MNCMTDWSIPLHCFSSSHVTSLTNSRRSKGAALMNGVATFDTRIHDGRGITRNVMIHLRTLLLVFDDVMSESKMDLCNPAVGLQYTFYSWRRIESLETQLSATFSKPSLLKNNEGLTSFSTQYYSPQYNSISAWGQLSQVCSHTWDSWPQAGAELAEGEVILYNYYMTHWPDK